MKKFKKIIAGLLMAAMCLFAICGCSNKPANDETTEPKEITICFFNGESKLGEIKVEEGKLIDASVYAAFENQENYEFTGWYETPTFLESSKKDLKTATFTEDNSTSPIPKLCLISLTHPYPPSFCPRPTQEISRRRPRIS